MHVAIDINDDAWRLGLRLNLLYSRKATTLAGAEREAWSQGLLATRASGQIPESDPRTHAIVTGRAR